MEHMEHLTMMKMQSLCGSNFNFALAQLFYTRYIDDIFSVWSSEHLLTTFFKYLNLVCKDIQLILDMNQKAVFLDLNVWRNGTRLCTSLYQKPLCRFLYIVPLSQHQRHVFSNFIVNEVRRYRLACSEDSDFLTCQLKFIGRLIRRGYPTSLITLVWSSTRATLPSPNPNLNPNPTSNPRSLSTAPCPIAHKTRFSSSNLFIVLDVPRLIPRIHWRDFFALPLELTTLETYKRIWDGNVQVIYKGQPKFSFYLTRSLFQRIDGEELSTRKRKPSAIAFS